MQDKKDVQEAVNALMGLAGLVIMAGMMEAAKKTPEKGKNAQDASTETPRQRFDRINREAHTDVDDLLDRCFSDGSMVTFQESPKGGCWNDKDAQYEGKPHICAYILDILDNEKQGVFVVPEGDVYNKEIGRAIALRRAMGKTVPQKYLYAGALLPTWEKRPAIRGESIRITSDTVTNTPLKKGDILKVMSCLPSGVANARRIFDGNAESWAVGVEDYEVKNV